MVEAKKPSHATVPLKRSAQFSSVHIPECTHAACVYCKYFSAYTCIVHSVHMSLSSLQWDIWEKVINGRMRISGQTNVYFLHFVICRRLAVSDSPSIVTF
jgi:hypothetical protein